MGLAGRGWVAFPGCAGGCCDSPGHTASVCGRSGSLLDALQHDWCTPFFAEAKSQFAARGLGRKRTVAISASPKSLTGADATDFSLGRAEHGRDRPRGRSRGIGAEHDHCRQSLGADRHSCGCYGDQRVRRSCAVRMGRHGAVQAVINGDRPVALAGGTYLSGPLTVLCEAYISGAGRGPICTKFGRSTRITVPAGSISPLISGPAGTQAVTLKDLNLSGAIEFQTVAARLFDWAIRRPVSQGQSRRGILKVCSSRMGAGMASSPGAVTAATTCMTF